MRRARLLRMHLGLLNGFLAWIEVFVAQMCARSLAVRARGAAGATHARARTHPTASPTTPMGRRASGGLIQSIEPSTSLWLAKPDASPTFAG
eukprot:5519309-Prymnesium_polylepis.1